MSHRDQTNQNKVTWPVRQAKIYQHRVEAEPLSNSKSNFVDCYRIQQPQRQDPCPRSPRAEKYAQRAVYQHWLDFKVSPWKQRFSSAKQQGHLKQQIQIQATKESEKNTSQPCASEAEAHRENIFTFWKQKSTADWRDRADRRHDIKGLLKASEIATLENLCKRKEDMYRHWRHVSPAYQPLVNWRHRRYQTKTFQEHQFNVYKEHLRRRYYDPDHESNHKETLQYHSEQLNDAGCIHEQNQNAHQRLQFQSELQDGKKRVMHGGCGSSHEQQTQRVDDDQHRIISGVAGDSRNHSEWSSCPLNAKKCGCTMMHWQESCKSCNSSKRLKRERPASHGRTRQATERIQREEKDNATHLVLSEMSCSEENIQVIQSESGQQNGTGYDHVEDTNAIQKRDEEPAPMVIVHGSGGVAHKVRFAI